MKSALVLTKVGYLWKAYSSILNEEVFYLGKPNIEHGGNVYVCSLDLRKAFDSVWIDGLLYR